MLLRASLVSSLVSNENNNNSSFEFHGVIESSARGVAKDDSPRKAQMTCASESIVWQTFGSGLIHLVKCICESG